MGPYYLPTETAFAAARRGVKIIMALPDEARIPILVNLRLQAGLIEYDSSRDEELVWMMITSCEYISATSRVHDH